MQDIRYRDPAQNASAIAQRLGLHRAGRGWRGRCPACGYAGALALDEREGRPLLWCASGCPESALAPLLRGAGGLPPRASAIFDAAPPITPASPARKRLTHRLTLLMADRAADDDQ